MRRQLELLLLGLASLYVAGVLVAPVVDLGRAIDATLRFVAQATEGR